MPVGMRPQLCSDRHAAASCGSFVVMSPPSPHVRFLLDWNENDARFARLPAGRILIAFAVAWAASSMTSNSCFWAIAMIASMSAGWPAKWTGITVRCCGVITVFSAFGSRLNVDRSISANTGTMLASMIAEGGGKERIGRDDDLRSPASRTCRDQAQS